MNPSKLSKKYRKINNLPVLQYADQQQQMQQPPQQAVNDQRSSVHLQGQSNQAGFTSSTTQRKFENAQAVGMVASASSNMQANSKSNSKAGNFFRRNTSN